MSMIRNNEPHALTFPAARQILHIHTSLCRKGCVYFQLLHNRFTSKTSYESKNANVAHLNFQQNQLPIIQRHLQTCTAEEKNS